MIPFSLYPNIAQTGLPNIYFPVQFKARKIPDTVFNTGTGLLTLPYAATVMFNWQVFIDSGAARPPTPAIFGAKIIKNPVASTNPIDAGWAGDWKQASIGTYGSQPGWMATSGSAIDNGLMGDQYGLFVYVTPENSAPITVNGHWCHTWLHGIIY